MAKKKQTPPNAEVFEIVWTEEAQQALWNVWAWLAEHNEEKADALYEEIRDKAKLLASHPLLGPVLTEIAHTETRQLVISKHYRLIYRPDPRTQTIFVLTLHPTRIPLSAWSEI